MTTYDAQSRISVLQTTVWWVVCSLLVVFLTFHFSIVTLSNLPRSPMTASISGLTARYVNPYFGQTWTFFAPQPVNDTLNLIVRGQIVDPATKAEHETEWVTVSEPLVNEVRRSRLSPLSLVQLGLSNVVIQYINRVSMDDRYSKPDKDHPGKRILSLPIAPSFDPLDLAVMTRTAMATLEIEYPGATFSKVQVAVTQHEFPRFSKRFETDDPSQVALFLVDWQKAQTVVPYCCSAGRMR